MHAGVDAAFYVRGSTYFVNEESNIKGSA
jgi:hypothetical protein